MTSIADIFLGSNWTDEQKLAVRRDAMWPIMLAMFNATGGNVRCGKHVPSAHIDSKNLIEVTDPLGFPLYRITKSGDEFFVSRYVDRYTANEHSLATDIRSKRVAYICSKITKKTGQLGNMISLEGDRVEAHSAVKSMLAKQMNYHLRTRKASHEYTTEMQLPIHLFVEMIDVIQGRKASMPNADKLDAVFNVASRKINNIRTAIEDFRNLFGREKWVVVDRNYDKPDSRAGYIVGAVNLEKLADKYTGIRSTWATTDFTEMQTVVPFQFYSSFDDIPTEIREPLLVSMMMAKVANPLYYPNVGEQEVRKLLPTAEFYDSDTGSVNVQLEYSRSDSVWGNIYAIDR
jgi:hypothetical protein